MNFNLYFFKDRSVSIDIQKVFGFFEQIDGCSFEYTDEKVTIIYEERNLNTKAIFYLTKRLAVPNIYKLNPKYANLNFHVEIDPMIPDFKALVLFKMMASFAHTFDLYVYCELFENILSFKIDTVVAAYTYFKKACKQLKKEEFENFHYIDKEKCDAIFEYIYEIVRLQLYYKDENIYVPKISFLASNLTDEVYTAIEWTEDTKTIFPSFVDFVYYKSGSEVKCVKYKEIKNVGEKYLNELPGFMKDTKVLNDSGVKKMKKIMKKAKFNLVNTSAYKLLNESEIIDV